MDIFCFIYGTAFQSYASAIQVLFALSSLCGPIIGCAFEFSAYKALSEYYLLFCGCASGYSSRHALYGQVFHQSLITQLLGP